MSASPRLSIITISFNNSAEIEATMRSVIDQDYSNIEYIVVDGASTDGTLNVIERYRPEIAQLISEPDNGMYEAINKGIRMATGEIVGLIHSGDRLYSSKIVSRIAKAFSTEEIDALYGHSVHVDSNDRIVRVNRSPSYSRGAIRRGWMPSHQSIYMKKSTIEKNGYYRTDLGPNGDYEFFIRHFYRNPIMACLLDEFVVRFALGGSSTTDYHRLLERQRIHARCWRLNNLQPPAYLIPFKLARKAPQFARGILQRIKTG
jgi:glycosyltransferase